MKKVDAEIKLEELEGSRIFDFIQLRYNGPHTDLLSERLSLGISIQFPSSSSNKLRIEELEVEQMLRQQEQDYQKQLDSLKLTKELNEFAVLLNKWKNNRNNLNQKQEELDSLVNQNMNVEFLDPSIILFQKERILKLQEDQLSLEDSIYNLYFDILERTIILGENQFTPYLWD